MPIKTREIEVTTASLVAGARGSAQLFKDDRALSKKEPKTLYLKRDHFKTFEKFCKENGRSPSQVVDALIDDFLEKVIDI